MGQPILDLVWCEIRLGLQEQGHGTGDHGRGHGGPADAEIFPVHDPVRVALAPIRTACQYTDDVFAGGDDIGLGETVRGGTEGRKGSDRVVCARGGSMLEAGAYSDNEGIIGRGGVGGVVALAIPFIAGSGDHNNAIEPQDLSGGIQGAGMVCLLHSGLDR